MELSIYINCIIAALLGQMAHIGVRVVKMAKRAKVANEDFSVSQYLADDKWPIWFNILFIVISVFVLDEFVKIKQEVLDYVKLTYLLLGYVGSSAWISALSKAEAKLNKAIDKKTDIADGKE